MPTKTTAIQYASPVTLNFTLAGLLGTDSVTGAGRQSDAVDNQTNLYDDILIGGKISGSFTTSPSAAVAYPSSGYAVEIWAFGSYDGTTFPAGLGSADANITISQSLRFALMEPLLNIFFDNGTDTDVLVTLPLQYVWGPISLANIFQGDIPRMWGLWACYNDSASAPTNNLDPNSAHFETRYTGVKLTST